MAQLEVDAIVGVTIIIVGFWRMAERRGYGRGGHFAEVLWTTVLPAPLASSSHCPFSARCPGTGRLCSPFSSTTSWCSCSVLPIVLVLHGLSVLRYASPFVVVLVASPMDGAHGALLPGLLASVLSRAEVEVHVIFGLC